MARLLLSTTLLFLTSTLLGAVEPHQGAWLSLDVPFSREPEAVALLEAQGLAPISWSNALVDVSAFSAVEQRPLAGLSQSLTAPDPRWDPWLSGLKPQFRPVASVARIWVEPSRYAEATRLLGGLTVTAKGVATAPSQGTGPRKVTGWMLLGFAFLYGIFRLLGEVFSPDFPSRNPRRWVWLGVTAGVFLVGILLVGGGSLPLGRPAGQAAQSEVSWARHRWFQESWPYGAGWKDWTPGKAWAYPTFERKEGRITPVTTSLPVPDSAWVQAAWASLDPHHAARIFGPENP